MNILNITLTLFLTTFIGDLIMLFMKTDGAEFVNPFYLKKRFRVNWFGAFMLALLFNVIAAPWAICYWVYKICTVGV